MWQLHRKEIEDKIIKTIPKSQRAKEIIAERSLIK
jgi:hypothetical protein